MAADDEVLRLLRSIDRRLALLTGPQEGALREALRTEVLRTTARIAMFEGIDGRRGSGELAKLGSVSERAAQLFVKEMLEMGLVRPADTGGGRMVIVEHDNAAILEWFRKRSPGEAK
ncbi:MAG TPA: hypothetical protein VF533_05575 [Solirubrobacteraceae bacterium]